MRPRRTAWLCAALSCGFATAAVALEAPARQPAIAVGRPVPVKLLPPERWLQDRLLSAVLAEYPQLLDVNDNSDTAFVGLALRPDGSVAANAIRYSDPRAVLLQQLPATLQSILPVSEGDGVSSMDWSRGADAGAGRRLGISVRLYYTRVPANFDASRSASRVRGIVAKYHSDLFLHAADPEVNRLTVLLNDDGSLLYRRVERMARAQLKPAPADAGQWAAEVAALLQVDVSRIGMMGRTVVQEWGRDYQVVFAWPRRAGEPGPQVLGPVPARMRLDLAAAQAIVGERFPAAFTGTGNSAGTPAIVSSADGTVLRSGFVPMQNGGLTHKALQEPVLAGVRVADMALEPISNPRGGVRDVLFVWEAASVPQAPLVPALPQSAATVLPPQGLRQPPVPPASAGATIQPDAVIALPALDPDRAADHALHVLLQTYPVLLEGPSRDSWYSAAVVLRADGTLFRSGLRFTQDRSQAIRDILDLRYIPGVVTSPQFPSFTRTRTLPALELKPSGEAVVDGQVLRNHLLFQYAVLPPDYDEERSLLLVWEAVLARHAELLLPRDAGVANRLTLFMTEDGRIAREKVEVGRRDDMLRGSSDFSSLGIRAEDIGVRGTTTLIRNDYSEVDDAPPDQQLRRAALWSALGVRDELIVHYAWPRRAGEPAGGRPPVEPSYRERTLQVIDGRRQP